MTARLERYEVRPYRPADPPIIRRLCHRVGYMGEPADWFWRHAESFAEIWTAYYTDQELASSFVSVVDDRIVGYLTGCVDSRRAPSPARALTRTAIRYGLFFRPGTARFLWRGLADSLRQGGAPSGEIDDPRWPSHLHINLIPEACGSGVGVALMQAWFDRLRDLGSPGCHLGTLLENARAVRFFERMGFARYGAPIPAPGMRSPAGRRHHLQLMVRDLRAP